MRSFLKAGFAAAWLALASAALASPTIELKDGSRIQGDIQGIKDGVYTVMSPSLGAVQVTQENIARIVYDGSSANRSDTPARNDGMSQEIQQVQQRLAQDPEAMKAIMSLQNDPQIQAILNDPAIMQAIEKGDYTSLLDNDKIKALESNPQLNQVLQQQAH
jgi:hypothetical protein